MSLRQKVFNLTLSNGCLKIVNLLIIILASRYLSVFEYGTYRQTFVIFDFISPLLLLGLSNAIFYYSSKLDSKFKVFINAVVIVVFSGILFSLFLVLGGNIAISNLFHNSELKNYVIWLIPYSIPSLIIALLNSYFVIINKTKILSISILLYSFVSIVVTLLVLIYYRTDISLIVSRILLVIVLFVLLILPACSTSDLRAAPSLFNLKLIREMFNYSVPIGLAGLVGIISLRMDKIIVSSFCSTQDFAIYANGAIEIPFISVITGAISVAILDQMAIYCEKKELKNASNLFNVSATKSAIFLFPLMIFLCFNAKSVIILMFTDKYIDSYIPFVIYLLIFPARIVYYGPTLIALGKSRSILIRSLVELILNLVLSLILIRKFGYNGVAFAGIISTYVWSVPFNLREISKGFQVSLINILPLKQLCQILIFSVLAILPTFLMKLFFQIDTLAIKLMLNLIIYTLMVLLLFNYYKFINIRKTIIFLKKGI